ncbi:hypothetical protein B0J15DRAFT_51359 [Fusarium solani]|uniref:Uncharacterized protein n=1 Tax=Fusarium solani TaxID=169388 RepID=A0A9P9K4P3_FUSSL|nr:uncharacterized protein B0J15DRAFT_51359 [Fusarium solani]KAH7249237.1 hypothetical protein B0J15DRAFT_51359 [Fusarium solani]
MRQSISSQRRSPLFMPSPAQPRSCKLASPASSSKSPSFCSCQMKYHVGPTNRGRGFRGLATPPVSLSKLPRFDRPITRRANREHLQSIRNCPLTTPAPSTRNALPLYISNVMLDETLDVGSPSLPLLRVSGGVIGVLKCSRGRWEKKQRRGFVVFTPPPRPRARTSRKDRFPKAHSVGPEAWNRALSRLNTPMAFPSLGNDRYSS